MITVVLVDDEPLVRGGMKMILDDEDDIEVIGEAGDGSDAVSLVRGSRPDVVCMDVRMPKVDGIRATELLLGGEHPPKIIVVTTFDHDDYVFAALRAGAAGFLLKRSGAEELLNAVRTVAQGDSLLFPAALRDLASRQQPTTWHGPALTAREQEVLTLVARGMNNAEIAAELWIGTETVRTHVANLLGKLGARDRTQAVVIAYTTGLVPLARQE